MGGSKVILGRRAVVAAAGLAVLGAGPRPAAGQDEQDQVTATAPVGHLELAVAARAPTSPTGVAVSRSGRMFVFMPRFDAKTVFSVGEVAADGAVTPFPDTETNTPDPLRPSATLFHIPNGVFDADDRLWLLDAGLMASSSMPVPGAPKLICIDIETRRWLATIPLDAVVESTSSLNDLRVSARDKTAFVSDQGQNGQGALIAIDLTTRRAVRRLARHPTTMSDKGILKLVEGQPVVKRGTDGSRSEVQGGANPIALSPDGQRVYYGPLIGRHLYQVDAKALLDQSKGDGAVADTIVDLGEKGLTGGIIADERDRIYLTLQEFNAVGRRNLDGTIEVLADDPRLIWADTLWITHDRWLYVSSSQVNRRAEFNSGQDRVQPPFAMLRMRIDAGPA